MPRFLRMFGLYGMNVMHGECPENAQMKKKKKKKKKMKMMKMKMNAAVKMKGFREFGCLIFVRSEK